MEEQIHSPLPLNSPAHIEQSFYQTHNPGNWPLNSPSLSDS